MDWEGHAKLIQVLSDRVDDGGDDFFNRKAEMRRLLAILATPPESVLVVIGPNDCGKTALLKHLKKVWRGNSELAATSPVFYFDMRKRLWRTPHDAAGHIGNKLAKWKDSFVAFVNLLRNGLAAVTIKKMGKFEIALKAISDELPAIVTGATKSDLAKVMESFSAVIGKSKVVHPIFILDEANKLKDWDHTDLTIFTDFFKSLVKQDKKAYLILSTSDDFFRMWLKKMFNPEHWDAFGVGWFKEKEARNFFNSYSLKQAVGTLPSTFGAAEWNDIYAVCGGSPYLLNRCATMVATHQVSWKDAAAMFATNRLGGVEQGFSAHKSSMGFSGDKYQLICRKIVDRGFVGVKAVLKDVYYGKRDECAGELAAMLTGNYIHVRYMTATALYEDVSFDEAGGETELIMACLPAHHAAMKMTLAEAGIGQIEAQSGQV